MQAGCLDLRKPWIIFLLKEITVMVLLDYSLGRENLETLLPFMVFNVERALEN